MTFPLLPYKRLSASILSKLTAFLNKLKLLGKWKKKPKSKLRDLFCFNTLLAWRGFLFVYLLLFKLISLVHRRSQHRNIFKTNTLPQINSNYFQYFASKSIGFIILSIQINFSLVSYQVLILIMLTCFTIYFSVLPIFLLCHSTGWK